jgi:hypothetical protein
MSLEPEKQAYLTDAVDLPADTTVWLTSQRRNWLAGRYVSVQWDMRSIPKRLLIKIS